MDEGSSKPDSGQDNAEDGTQFAYRLVELVVTVVLVGGLWWLLRTQPPLGPIARTLLSIRIWLIVLVVSVSGAAGGLIPYYIGQRGTKAVFNHYPSLEGRPWKRLMALFKRWGARSLILSGIPVLGTALIVGAGAFGIERTVFLRFVFVGKILRNWVIAFLIVFGFRILG